MTEILDQEHMAPPRSHSQTLDAAASIQARALREGRPWRCGKLGDKTDNARCISRRIQAHKHGKQHAPCHDCTIPAMIQNQKLPLRDTPAAAPVPVVENKENNPMSKRGTCVECKRDGMSIIGKGLCGACYYRDRRAKAKDTPLEQTAPAAQAPELLAASTSDKLSEPSRPCDIILPMEADNLPAKDFVVSGIEFEAGILGKTNYGPPTASFGAYGKLSFSAAASVKFGLSKYSYIRLYPSKDRTVLGIKLCSEKLPGTRRLIPDGSRPNSQRFTYNSIAKEMPEIIKKALTIEATDWDTFLIVRVPQSEHELGQ